MDKKLTPKQKMFIKEYLVDLNATQSAIRAGYSKKTANRIATENLSKPVIQEAITQAMEKRENKLEITADRVLKEFARLAFVDPRNFFNPDGSTKAITALDEDTARAVAGFDVVDMFDGKGKDQQKIGYIKKYKIADKLSALEALAKHLGITSENIKVSGFEEAIQGVYERADRAVEEYRRIKKIEENRHGNNV